MGEYQVLARKYRPQRFIEVIGQESIITTLKNAIKNHRLAHAYLFCGPRGTGKTTLARIFAKALNCPNPNADGEPCNICSSCKEITSGYSLDVLEIDGASHRGIDDVRQINETVGYATSSGGYKIYIIDEVHMLTKEAFNALLKTLEEPPAKVMFFFATTEPHKVLPTILSRCQRFNLNRIPVDQIVKKLKEICQDQGIIAREEALRLVAHQAEGGLRDAESLLDQIISFHEGEITLEVITTIFGLMPQETFFTLDAAGKAGNLAIAFEIAHQVFSQGKDLLNFIESLTHHFRTLLMLKMSGKTASFLDLSHDNLNKYEASAKLYSQEQILNVIDYLLEAQNQMRFSSSSQIALEALLLRVLRSHQRLPVEYLVKRLTELEKSVASPSLTNAAIAASTPPLLQTKATVVPPPQPPQPPAQPSQPSQPPKPSTPTPTPKPPTPLPKASLSLDPTPTPADLGIADKPIILNNLSPQKQSRMDTLLQFAAVELEGTIHRKRG